MLIPFPPATLGDVDDVVEDGQPAKIVVLADFICLQSELGNVEATHRRRRARILRGKRHPFVVEDLRTGADDDAVRLWIGTVAGIAGRIEKVSAVPVVQDRGAPVVAAIGIGLGEMKPAMRVNVRNHAIEAAGDGIGGIDDGRRI